MNKLVNELNIFRKKKQSDEYFHEENAPLLDPLGDHRKLCKHAMHMVGTWCMVTYNVP